MEKVTYIEKCPISGAVIRKFTIGDGRTPTSSPCPGPCLLTPLLGEKASEYTARQAQAGSPNQFHKTIFEAAES